ncbi:glycoside hydrolase family 9 protein [Maribacter sp. HTCC2170]|uniref:glycoside hydrolase family 9 protein n=1 Tax=Maribacter sp. (strain HTCC2170 / KCCM 42371) TaxID=313603 RepID=UPI00006B1A6D|nr:glycoside hydrolase family 9 protein [Maribacter sp. HTCC2170]EAR00895.1 endochitinase [Maribacter sp. HTCC2170]
MSKLFVSILILSLGISYNLDNDEDRLLINHLGYHVNGAKNVVYQTNSNVIPDYFEIRNKSGKTFFTGKFKKGGKIDNWHTGKAYSGDFTDLKTLGDYQVVIQLKGKVLKSHLFNVGDNNLVDETLPLLLKGFKSQHVVGEYDQKDSTMSFFGNRNDMVDVHGGWYDASGEKGKYFSHLCFSNYLNPQQTPLFVWNLFEAANQYTSKEKFSNPVLKTSVLEEAYYGADFLLRMHDTEGYFYLTVFANWSGDPNEREICAYEGQDGKRTADYKAGFREGAGIAIAALARASSNIGLGEYEPEEYLRAAEKGFAHLLEFNDEYIDDGIENIIDDYCALLAATELFDATNDQKYLAYARKRMVLLSSRLNSDNNYRNWWKADDKGERPFYHGSDAGLPLIALSRYLEFEFENNSRKIAIKAIQQSIDFEIKITNDVNNPFGYPRQYIKAVNEDNNRASFFIPHKNESGYWWQGENSRLASLSSAFYISMKYMTESQKKSALEYAANNINWIMGLNPYDVNMVDGLGFNNPEYIEQVNLNFKGGVCNGITAGFTDENDIAFMPLPQNNDPAQRWRWSEQWMPHGAWLILAVSSAR